MFASIPIDATFGMFQMMTYGFTTLAVLLSWFMMMPRG